MLRPEGYALLEANSLPSVDMPLCQRSPVTHHHVQNHVGNTRGWFKNEGKKKMKFWTTSDLADIYYHFLVSLLQSGHGTIASLYRQH